MLYDTYMYSVSPIEFKCYSNPLGKPPIVECATHHKPPVMDDYSFIKTFPQKQLCSKAHALTNGRGDFTTDIVVLQLWTFQSLILHTVYTIQW